MWNTIEHEGVRWLFEAYTLIEALGILLCLDVYERCAEITSQQHQLMEEFMCDAGTWRLPAEPRHRLLCRQIMCHIEIPNWVHFLKWTHVLKFEYTAYAARRARIPRSWGNADAPRSCFGEPRTETAMFKSFTVFRGGNFCLTPAAADTAAVGTAKPYGLRRLA